MSVTMLRPGVSVQGRTITGVQRNSVRNGRRGVSVVYAGGGRDWFADGADVAASGVYREPLPAGPVVNVPGEARKVRASVESLPGASYLTKLTSNMNQWDR